MEKNPDIVARLAGEREHENIRFRTFLKMASHQLVRRVNAVAQQAGEEAQNQMDCTTCAACCRDNLLPLNEDEIIRLAVRLGLDRATFEQRHLVKDDLDHQPALDAQPCPFLLDNRCTIYDDRPEACRGYPYIGGDIPSRMWGIIERAETCPVVFEMLQQTKAAIGFDRFSSRPKV